MNLSLVERIVNAVLYEGYILYPYRPSAVKNQQRWNFGVLYPPTYSEAQQGTDAWSMQTECLVQGDARTALDVKVRFLHLLSREVGVPTKDSSIADGGRRMADDDEPQVHLSDSHLRVVPSLEVGGQVFQTWQEAVERDVSAPRFNLSELAAAPQTLAFTFPSKRETEPLRDSEDQVAGVIVRKQQAIEGAIELRLADCGSLIEQAGSAHSAIRHPPWDRLFKLTIRILNRTPFESADQKSRDEALMRAFVSTHTILSVCDGEFVSLLDPPEVFREAAASCRNVGTWPVLVGAEGARDCLLSSPIILYDYPQIAPESAGDLFDGTEIDEILTLRIMTLTDEEKREMRGADERARRILERTETLPPEQLMKLHGAVRRLRPVGENGAEQKRESVLKIPMMPEGVEHSGWEWQLLEEKTQSDRISVCGIELGLGARVRLRPRAGGDIFDLALAGQVAIIESIEQDYEGRMHLAVVLEDDPGRDLGMLRQPGHRFFFAPEEVEPLMPGETEERN